MCNSAPAGLEKARDTGGAQVLGHSALNAPCSYAPAEPLQR